MRELLTEKVLKTIRNYDMLAPGDVILAAVSGGPDSVFMLHVLNRLKRKFKVKDIIVCNLDHGIRGEESKVDSSFVKKAAGKLGLKFIHKKINLNKLKSKEYSIEEMARSERYIFFREAARKASANIVATGHTLDDQAETVLMRLIKGSSLKGLVGIPPVREEKGLKIIRPLAELEKSEIVRYLRTESIPYKIDRTNLEERYLRNAIRRDVIPFLEKYNPRLKRSLFNLAEHLREDFEFISEEKTRIQKDIVRQQGSSVEIRLRDVVIQPRAIQKEILRDSLEKAGGEVKSLSFRHWKDIEGLIKHGRKGNSIDLPGSIRASRTQDILLFNRI